MKAATRTRKVQTNKTNYMSDKAFADLKGAFEGALAYEQGDRRDLRVSRIQAPRPPKAMSPKDIARIRQKLNCSQAVFAMMLNISPKTVQAWEQGSREPGDAALKLLTIAKNHPEVLFESLTCKISTFSIWLWRKSSLSCGLQNESFVQCRVSAVCSSSFCRESDS